MAVNTNIPWTLRPIYAVPPVEPPFEDNSVPEPIGWKVEAGDGQISAVALHDPNAERSTINETNETQPFAIFADYEHTPSGKIICSLEQRPSWILWIIDLLGQRNFDQLATHADGYMDTEDVNVEGDYPLMCSAQGGSLLNVTEIYIKSGSKFCICETLEFDKEPIKIGDTWYYEGHALSWETHPHLFASRVNKVATKIITWMTATESTSKSDPRKGDEHWPYISNRIATQPLSDLRLYPELPATLRLHNKSVVEDGNLVYDTVSREIVVDAYKFRGSNTYVREQSTGKWYLADEMLIRAAIGYPGNGFDYRCYVSVKPLEPWMGAYGYRVPVCGWMRKDVTTLQIVLNKVREFFKSLI